MDSTTISLFEKTLVYNLPQPPEAVIHGFTDVRMM
uniref:Uncharacterized protein n=1 Tax=Anguilla anguilla TaxID=7936 RepID=A0A0E9VCG7_ANGAN